MHREVDEEDIESVTSQQPRLLLKDPDTMAPPVGSINGRLTGVYQHVSYDEQGLFITLTRPYSIFLSGRTLLSASSLPAPLRDYPAFCNHLS